MEIEEAVFVSEYEEEIVLHFGSEGPRINAYTLASTLVSLSDAIKEANLHVNPGYEVEIVVEAFGPGSFRARIRSSYRKLGNLFDAQDVKSVALSILASYIFLHTLTPDQDVNIEVNDDQVIVKAGDKTIIVPRTVYEAQKELERSEKFKESIARTFDTVKNDQEVTSFGVTREIADQTPDIEIPEENFYLLSESIDLEAPTREISEIADLQIKRAILERSKRKWEFVWRGVKISAPVLDDKFYDEFFAHKIKIAPGDSLDVLLKVHQAKDPDTGIYTNTKYEVIQVNKHIPRMEQADMKI